ncbi:organic cation transporter protein-like [Scylla paramamosain]|uniref:organic cation transporter protein-like n=1 Tax=Scylla paramamosain TaxID=85552 RepID=UPI0030829CDE
MMDPVFESTLTSQFNLVCGRAYLRATYQSMYSFSSIAGSLVSGFAADRYGRKPVVVVSQILYVATAIGITFLSSFNGILAFRFILGSLGTPTFYMMGMEVCETKWRSLVGIVMALPWAIGTMLWGGAGYLIRDWYWLQLFVSLPTLIVIPVLFLIDESPRWLIVTGRHDKALKVLRRASRLNKTTLPSDSQLLSMFKEIEHENEQPIVKTDSITSLGVIGGGDGRCALSWPKLLSTNKMRIVILALTVNLFISSLVYCGLSLSGATYSTDPFLYMVLSGLMETPGYSLTAPIIKKWGRKVPTMIGFFICGVVILSLAFIPSEISWLVMTFALLGKLTISGSFMILFVYEAELLPTEVRLMGLAVTIIAANLAGSFSAYIADYLSPLVPWLPSVIFGVSSFVACLMLIPLPETLGMPLPDTIEDLTRLWRSKGKKLSYTGDDDSQTEKLTT